MSYRSIKRVLGETSLERKCRFLFGACLLVLITGSFWWYGRSTERLVYEASRESARGLVETIIVMHHWKFWQNSEDQKWGGEFGDLVEDLRAVVEWAREQSPDLPIFVLGHSNGGQVVLRLALDPPEGVVGVIASNPSIRIAMHVPPAKLKLGKFLLSFVPWMTLRADARSDWMTRDPQMQTIYRTDGLRHNRISAPLFFGMVEGGEMLLRRAGEIRVPILMIVGGQDPVICPQANREFFDRLGSPDKLFHLYPKMLHEPFNELGREQVFTDLIRWLEPRLPQS